MREYYIQERVEQNQGLILLSFRHVRDGDLFDAIERFCAGGDVMHGVKNLGAVISRTALIADAHYDAFKNNKSLLVLERLASHFLGTDSAVAVLT